MEWLHAKHLRSVDRGSCWYITLLEVGNRLIAMWNGVNFTDYRIY